MNDMIGDGTEFLPSGRHQFSHQGINAAMGSVSNVALMSSSDVTDDINGSRREKRDAGENGRYRCFTQILLLSRKDEGLAGAWRSATAKPEGRNVDFRRLVRGGDVFHLAAEAGVPAMDAR